MAYVSLSQSLKLNKGVDHDSDERTIKVAYRKLALKYRKLCYRSNYFILLCIETHSDNTMQTLTNGGLTTSTE